MKKESLSPACAFPDAVEVDAMKRMTVPYQFCSDEFEAASTGCEAFDRGADPYEVASSAMTQYRNYFAGVAAVDLRGLREPGVLKLQAGTRARHASLSPSKYST